MVPLADPNDDSLWQTMPQMARCLGQRDRFILQAAELFQVTHTLRLSGTPQTRIPKALYLALQSCPLPRDNRPSRQAIFVHLATRRLLGEPFSLPLDHFKP